MGSHSRAVAMSGGAKKSSATMSCICPADCCSPEEVEKEENYVWLLIKVLYGQWIVMGSLALPIIIRLSCLEEEVALVCLVTFLLFLLSLPIIFGNHAHQEPACYCNTSHTSEDDKEKNSYKLLAKKKKTRKASKKKVAKK